jgi:hypothetical protein
VGGIVVFCGVDGLAEAIRVEQVAEVAGDLGCLYCDAIKHFVAPLSE